MTLNTQDYRKRVLGCWMGKNIGGTLGAPMEFLRQVNNVTFYQQKLGGEPLPNDDLDIQLLWLVALEERGLDLTAQTLADYWCLYVTPHWSEYGIAKVNMRSGLLPPLCGTCNNDYRHSCGAFIRSEIWACIAPGQPELAARYAIEDAILDHGRGEGTYAEVFCATLESAAFVNQNLRELIGIGLSYIPEDCGVARAIHTAIACIDQGMDLRAARDAILELHRGSTCLGDLNRTSPEDQAKGFHLGSRGYDVPSNIAILVYGLLAGGDDFDTMICTTVNMGEDADCTAATAGSIFGILHGIEAIPRRWIEPIGNGIKVACLNLGELMLGEQLPRTIDELTARTERVARRVALQGPASAVAFHDHDATTALAARQLTSSCPPDRRFGRLDATRFVFPFFTVDVNYGDDPRIRSGEPRTLHVVIHNTYKTQANVCLRWYLPDAVRISPSPLGVVQSLPCALGDAVTVTFTLEIAAMTEPLLRGVLELTLAGLPTVMTVPVMLMNGDLQPRQVG